MKLSVTHKKLLSAFGVVVAGSALTLLNAYVVKLPTELQGFVGSVLGGALLLIKAWGTAEEQAAEVHQQVVERVSAVIEAER
jgi:hypothetical protein